jgi:hypothetical protein
MTHSNHRRGSRESLMGDWVVFSYSRDGQTPENNRKLVEIYTRYDPVACSLTVTENGRRARKRYFRGWEKKQESGVHRSTTLEELRNIKEPWGCSAVYDKKDSVQGVIRELGENDFGNCTVVSGIFDEVFDISVHSKLAYPHTVNMSAETFGRLDLLPAPKILEITTMCGHHFVSPYLVKDLIDRVKEGSINIKEAAVEMAKQCTCNFFNVARAEKLIREYTAST